MPGCTARISRGGLQAGHPRHRYVEDREVERRRAHGLDRLDPVAGLGHDTQVGLGVENETQAATHDRMVVGEQHARRMRRHGRRARAAVRTRRAAAGIRLDVERRADQHGPLAHAAQPGTANDRVGVEPARHRRARTSSTAAEPYSTPRCACRVPDRRW